MRNVTKHIQCQFIILSVSNSSIHASQGTPETFLYFAAEFDRFRSIQPIYFLATHTTVLLNPLQCPHNQIENIQK